MLLRVRRGQTESLVEGKGALARLYRTRRVAPDDHVWDPARGQWVSVGSFLFVGGDPDGRSGNGARAPWRPRWAGRDGDAGSR